MTIDELPFLNAQNKAKKFNCTATRTRKSQIRESPLLVNRTLHTVHTVFTLCQRFDMHCADLITLFIVFFS